MFHKKTKAPQLKNIITNIKLFKVHNEFCAKLNALRCLIDVKRAKLTESEIVAYSKSIIKKYSPKKKQKFQKKNKTKAVKRPVTAVN